MAIDRVQAVKWESPSKGGTQLDLTPSEIDVHEDFLECRGVAIQNDTSDDETVLVSRDVDGNLTLQDDVTGLKTLAELASGGASIIETRGVLTVAGGVVYTRVIGGVAIVTRAP